MRERGVRLRTPEAANLGNRKDVAYMRRKRSRYLQEKVAGWGEGATLMSPTEIRSRPPEHHSNLVRTPTRRPKKTGAPNG